MQTDRRQKKSRSRSEIIAKMSCMVLPVMVLLLFLSVSPAAGAVEMRIDRDTLQSFVKAVFPLTVTQEITVLGVFKTPVAITLANPGEIRFRREERGAPVALDVAMDYELASPAGLIPPSRGRASGQVIVTVAPGEDHLLLTFAGVEVAVSPALRLLVSPLSQPVKVPLPRAVPIKIHDKTVYGRFHHLSLRLDGEVLIVKGDVAFSATATPPPAGPDDAGRPAS